MTFRRPALQRSAQLADAVTGYRRLPSSHFAYRLDNGRVDLVAPHGPAPHRLTPRTSVMSSR